MHVGFQEDPYCLLQSCHGPRLMNLLRLVMVGSRLERWINGHSIRVIFCLFYLTILLLLVFILFISLWRSKWERTKHQLTQRLQTHLTSLHVLAFAVRDRLHVERQRLCLCLGDASSQILSWMGNLHVLLPRGRSTFCSHVVNLFQRFVAGPLIFLGRFAKMTAKVFSKLKMCLWC